MIWVECPYCAGESGSKDYFGEWCECDCCNPPRRPNETGRIVFWRLWLYRFDIWRMNRRIMREMKRS